jgi:type VII secretion integral membrane protein EccD
MVSFCRVTVIGSGRRVDVTLPEGVPVADLLLDLAGMLGERSDGVPARWALVRVGGHALDPEHSLADQGVASGTMLFFRDVTEGAPPLAIDDFAQQVAITVDAETGQWAAGMFRWLLAAAGAACLFAAGALVLLAGDRGVRTVAGAVGAALSSLAGVALVRLVGRRDFAGLITFAAIPLWAAAGAGLATVAGADATGVLGAALAAACVAAAVALLVVGNTVLPISIGVVAAALPPAVVLGGTYLFGAGLVAAAAILCPVGLAGVALASQLAVGLGGVPTAGVSTASAMSVDLALIRARRLSAAVLTGTALMLAASFVVLARSGGWLAWGLIAVASIAVAAQARHHRFAAEVAPLLAAALVGLLLLEFPLVDGGGPAVAATVLIADGILLGVAAAAIRGWKMPEAVDRRMRTVEWIAIAASVPLALGVLGVYDAVVRFARGLS